MGNSPPVYIPYICLLAAQEKTEIPLSCLQPQRDRPELVQSQLNLCERPSTGVFTPVTRPINRNFSTDKAVFAVFLSTALSA